MKQLTFVLKLKGTEAYFKNVIDGVCYNTWNIDMVMKFKCKTELKGQIKVDEDKYEIVEVNS